MFLYSILNFILSNMPQFFAFCFNPINCLTHFNSFKSPFIPSVGLSSYPVGRPNCIRTCFSLTDCNTLFLAAPNLLLCLMAVDRRTGGGPNARFAKSRVSHLTVDKSLSTTVVQRERDRLMK